MVECEMIPEMIDMCAADAMHGTATIAHMTLSGAPPVVVSVAMSFAALNPGEGGGGDGGGEEGVKRVAVVRVVPQR